MDLLSLTCGRKFATILADPPWRFTNKTGKVAPEHKRLSRYGTMALEEIMALPVAEIVATPGHLYLWCPNAMLPEGLAVMQAWGFTYKSNIIWHKIRKDGGSDGRGVGFYFRNVTELILFGVKGKNARTLAPGRRQVNLLATRKREHSRKPDEQYDLIESCSPGPYIELFARHARQRWVSWGNEMRKSGCFSGTERQLMAGDRFVYFDGRTGVANEFMQDGEADVIWDDGNHATIKWNHMYPVAWSQKP
jgi:N6-adenosine-specific RNA methylase IME4